jgi:KaiC/GvpD/RAD55 family RecA-like ATPase
MLMSEDESIQEQAENMASLFTRLVQDSKNPFEEDATQITEEDNEKFHKLINRPIEKKCINSNVISIKTFTLLDNLFWDAEDNPLGGVPIGAQIGIVGLPDSGKSILMQELALQTSSNNTKVLFVTTEDIFGASNNRFDLQSRMLKKAEILGLDWEKIRENLYILDAVEHVELLGWKTFVKIYKWAIKTFDIKLVIIDSITYLDDRRASLKNHIINMSRFNQTNGITGFYVCQRSSDDADGYAIAGGIGLAHGLDANVCIEQGKVSGKMKDDINLGRVEQLKQWALIRFVRIMGCRICNYDASYFELEITKGGFVRLAFEERAKQEGKTNE